jgi:hypothetical protein
MDQGWATVVAAVLGLAGGGLLVGGTLLGGFVEPRRANGRAEAERDWQCDQLARQWQHEEELAAKERLRAARIRRLLSTRDLMLATLNDRPPAGSLVEAIRDLDRDSLGDPSLFEEFQAVLKLTDPERTKAAAALNVRLIQAAAAQEDRILAEMTGRPDTSAQVT